MAKDPTLSPEPDNKKTMKAKKNVKLKPKKKKHEIVKSTETKSLKQKKKKQKKGKEAGISNSKVKAKRKRQAEVEGAPKKVKKIKKTSSIDEKTEKVENKAFEADDNPLLKGAKPLSEVRETFQLSKEAINALQKRNINSLFEIQVKTFPFIRQGKDVIGRARTGMGKTLAFCLPVVEKLREDGQRAKKGRGPVVMVVAPTRELAKQVCREFKDTAPHLSTTTVYGGVPMSSQTRAMYLGLDVVVGTPGRIIDHIERKNLKLGEINHLILDEADQMLDMGFKDDMDKIFDAIKKAKDPAQKFQVLLFSATLPGWVNEVAKKKMNSPVKIDLVGDMESASKDVQHLCLQCPWHARGSIINDLIKVYAPGKEGRTIVFCSTKKECNELAVNETLSSKAKVIHGDIAQTHREATLHGFRSGRFPVLIATDVAARGLDIKGVDLVINSEPPSGNFSGRADVDAYVHRSGRTGRAGKKGVCITLFKYNQTDLIKEIEKQTSNTLARIGAPQKEDLINAAADSCAEEFEKIDETVFSKFIDKARYLIDKMGAEKALSVALAKLTGFADEKSLKCRSLLSGQEGYVTFQFQHSLELRGGGFVWSVLRRLLPTEAVEGCRGMTLTADCVGAVFDVEEKHAHILKELIEAGKERKISVCTELPELKMKPQSYTSSKSLGSMRGPGRVSYRGRGRGRGLSRGRGGRRGYRF